MPMGNGTGPDGMGPRTGRGAGFCNGYGMPGACNRGGGFGFRRGGARGAGRGFGGGMGGRFGFYGNPYWNQNAAAPQQFSSEDQQEMLKNEADFLEKRLSEIRQQLDKDSE